MLLALLRLAWGLAQGMRHALEPDHLAAVSALVASRGSTRSAWRYAAAWGLGHAFVLTGFGGVLLFARRSVPPRTAARFELLVAATLLVLGALALRRALSAGSAQDPSHTTPPLARSSVSTEAPARARASLTGRALLVGCVHGLAGSGALAAAVLSDAPSPLLGLVYIAVYGAGAALGMSLVARLAGAPMERLLRTDRGRVLLLGTAGTLSVILGLVWGWSVLGAAG